MPWAIVGALAVLAIACGLVGETLIKRAAEFRLDPGGSQSPFYGPLGFWRMPALRRSSYQAEGHTLYRYIVLFYLLSNLLLLSALMVAYWSG